PASSWLRSRHCASSSACTSTDPRSSVSVTVRICRPACSGPTSALASVRRVSGPSSSATISSSGCARESLSGLAAGPIRHTPISPSPSERSTAATAASICARERSGSHSRIGIVTDLPDQRGDWLPRKASRSRLSPAGASRRQHAGADILEPDRRLAGLEQRHAYRPGHRAALRTVELADGRTAALAVTLGQRRTGDAYTPWRAVVHELAGVTQGDEQGRLHAHEVPFDQVAAELGPHVAVLRDRVAALHAQVEGVADDTGSTGSTARLLRGSFTKTHTFALEAQLLVPAKAIGSAIVGRLAEARELARVTRLSVTEHGHTLVDRQRRAVLDHRRNALFAHGAVLRPGIAGLQPVTVSLREGIAGPVVVAVAIPIPVAIPIAVPVAVARRAPTA